MYSNKSTLASSLVSAYSFGISSLWLLWERIENRLYIWGLLPLQNFNKSSKIFLVQQLNDFKPYLSSWELHFWYPNLFLPIIDYGSSTPNIVSTTHIAKILPQLSLDITWSILVENTLRSFILDHGYTSDCTTIVKSFSNNFWVKLKT